MGLIRLLSGTVALFVTVEAFSVYAPNLQRAPGREASIRRRAPCTTSVRHASVLFRTTRWDPLAFKPDESVDLYGDDDMEDPEDPKPTDSERLGVMATFLATRLSSAYLRTAQGPKENVGTTMKEPEAEEYVEDFQKTLSEVQVAQAKTETAWKAATEEAEESTSIPVAEEALPIKVDDPAELEESDIIVVAEEAPLPETDEAETASLPVAEEAPSLETYNIEDAPTEFKETAALTEMEIVDAIGTPETVAVESVSESLETASVDAGIEEAEGESVESKAGPMEAASSEVEVKESRETEAEPSSVETIEIPSLMHKKEGDRSIGLKDEFVEADVEISLAKNGRDGAPSVPAEISMEFGKPLEIVKDNLSPISP